ncbi:hypothetical protein D3C85_1449210 [compost metagenome]
MYDFPVIISYDLHFDMPWAIDKFLQEYRIVAKSIFRLTTRFKKAFFQLLIIMYDAHSTPTATRGRLNH